MKYLKTTVKILILLVIGTFMINSDCDEREDKRSHFKWTGIINGYDDEYDIYCDDSCNICKAWLVNDDTSGYITLSKSNYSTVYDKCLSIPTPGTRGTVDTIKNTTYMGNFIDFGYDGYLEYGFDDCHISGQIYDSGNTYISVAQGGFTKFTVFKIDEILDSNKTYNKIYAKIANASTNKVYFDKDYTVDSIEFDHSHIHYVPIYAKADAITSQPIAINIYAESDPSAPVCISGIESVKSEVDLYVVVYKEVKHNDWRLYLINNPTFNPDTNTWNIYFNDILKQAVIKIGQPIVIKDNSNLWDKNANHQLDIFKSSLNLTDTVTDFDEMFQVFKFFGEDTACADNKNSSIFVIGGPINIHWLVTDINVPIGATTIGLNTVKGLNVNDEIYLGPWLGMGTENKEKLYISSINDLDSNNCFITVAQDSNLSILGTKYQHSQYESFYYSSKINGFTINSCSFCKGDVSLNTVAHEFLHQQVIGNLNDVVPRNNIMHGYENTRSGIELRYRKCAVKDTIRGITDDEQWTKIKR